MSGEELMNVSFDEAGLAGGELADHQDLEEVLLDGAVFGDVGGVGRGGGVDVAHQKAFAVRCHQRQNQIHFEVVSNHKRVNRNGGLGKKSGAIQPKRCNRQQISQLLLSPVVLQYLITTGLEVIVNCCRDDLRRH